MANPHGMSNEKQTGLDKTNSAPVYLDCYATTPIEPEVNEIVQFYLTKEFGNSGSRSHQFGATGKRAVESARDEVAAVVNGNRDEVIFTSGATESNNLAILGLEKYGREKGNRHIISSQIEHHSVLGPVRELEKRGFEVTLLPCGSDGRISGSDLEKSLKRETLLVSLMQVNNETGVSQPIAESCEIMEKHPAFFHVDAVQGFGKELDSLTNSRIDMISLSGHKIFAPKGVGALITRRRGPNRIPLRPIVFGGGQERGLRSGTLPVALIAGLGKASQIAMRDHICRNSKCLEYEDLIFNELSGVQFKENGDAEYQLPNILNLSFTGVDSEAFMLQTKDLIAVSNGSACSSQKHETSHVLKAMQLSEAEASSAIRISWCHLTQNADWNAVRNRIHQMQMI